MASLTYTPTSALPHKSNFQATTMFPFFSLLITLALALVPIPIPIPALLSICVSTMYLPTDPSPVLCPIPIKTPSPFLIISQQSNSKS